MLIYVVKPSRRHNQPYSSKRPYSDMDFYQVGLKTHLNWWPKNNVNTIPPTPLFWGSNKELAMGADVKE